jgi:hypothetical protein
MVPGYGHATRAATFYTASRFILSMVLIATVATPKI